MLIQPVDTYTSWPWKSASVAIALGRIRARLSKTSTVDLMDHNSYFQHAHPDATLAWLDIHRPNVLVRMVLGYPGGSKHGTVFLTSSCLLGNHAARPAETTLLTFCTSFSILAVGLCSTVACLVSDGVTTGRPSRLDAGSRPQVGSLVPDGPHSGCRRWQCRFNVTMQHASSSPDLIQLTS